MRDIIFHIIRYTGDLGFIDTIKITDKNDKTEIEAVNDDKSVVINGELKKPLNLFGGSFGMTDFSLIKGLFNSPTFKTDESEIKVDKKVIDESDKEIPVGILFKDNKGQEATYRFMHESLLPKLVKFKEESVRWDIKKFKPSSSKISEFSSFAGLYNNEKFFSIFVKDKNLKIAIGNKEGSSSNIILNLEENISNNLETLYWPIVEFLSIMKLALEKENDVEISISQKGVMMIKVETQLAYWKYIMPAYRM